MGTESLSSLEGLTGLKIREESAQNFISLRDSLEKNDLSRWGFPRFLIGMDDPGSIPGTATTNWFNPSTSEFEYLYTPVAFTCVSGFACRDNGEIKLFHHVGTETSTFRRRLIIPKNEIIVGGIYGSKQETLNSPNSKIYGEIGLQEIHSRDNKDNGFTLLLDRNNRQLVYSFIPFQQSW